MVQYLYGASVQGIQRFIFQTNELKDIVGASELVELICTDLFKYVVGKRWREDNQIISAAGNVKYIFDSKAECEQVVRLFPREVMKTAPDISISQAVVKLQDDFTHSINELENKLRSQRNKSAASITTGRLGIKRSPQTGLPTTNYEKNEGLDASTYAKRKQNKTIKLCQKSFGIVATQLYGDSLIKHIPFDISDITVKNDWIAVIHADGNGLGKVIQKIGHNHEDFKTFSQELDKATIQAANAAFNTISPKDGWSGIIPLRPIVLGGDDMTIIIRGDLAIDYVTEFIKQFETHTSEGKMKLVLSQARMERLTACAGIAFIKSSYPFYYGYALAEQLCDRAKKNAKTFYADLAPSCLMFHKVQDSFVMRYDDMVKRELTTANENSFCFGPYYLNENGKPHGYYTIKELKEESKKLMDESTKGIKTGIRQWLTLMYEDEGKAEQRLIRLKALNEKQNDLIDKLTSGRTIADDKKAYPAYDILTYHTIINQQTKEEQQ
jgi:hypothetical protein